MTMRRWKRADVTTALLCWAIYRHGAGALDYLRDALGIPAKMLMVAVDRDTRRGYVNWGVSVWRPFLDTRGTALVQAVLTGVREEKDVRSPSVGQHGPGGVAANHPVGATGTSPS